MILKPKSWTKEDVNLLLEQHKLTPEQFETLTGIETKLLQSWLGGKRKLDIVACFALDRVEDLLKTFFRKQEV